MKGNVIVGQSGGPTAAINSSLAGVYRTARDRGASKVYGMLHGIQGLLQERYIDLSEYITNEVNKVNSKHFPDIKTAADYIKNNVSKDKILFLKGSRSMKLEGLITALS